MLTCNYCSAYAPNKASLTRHLRYVHQISPICRKKHSLCPLVANGLSCSKPMPSGYINHIEQFHPDITLVWQKETFLTMTGNFYII